MTMQGTKRIANLLAIILIMLSCGCASDRAPSGGPADTTPLRVVLSSPEPSEINVSPARIRLTFNHFFTGRQLAKAIAFSPSVGKYDLLVDGRKAEIRLFEPLNPNTTYVLFIDKNLKDFRGRSFSEPFSIAFSTGPSINRGTIQGKVYNSDYTTAGNTLLMAYSSGREPSDSKTLLKSSPDFLTQTDDTGTFSFRNIPPGRYRIFAVNDRQRDMRYSGPDEEIALTSSEFTSDGTSGLSLMLGKGPSATGFVVSCRALDRRHIEIRTSGPVSPATFGSRLPEVREQVSGTRVPITSWYGKNRSMLDDEFILATAPMLAGRIYRIGPEGPGGTEFFGSGAKLPEKPLGAAVFPENGTDPAYLSKGVQPLGNAVVIRFTEPVDKPAVTRAAVLQEIQGKSVLPYTLTAIDPYTWALKPLQEMKPGNSYKVRVDLSAIASPLTGKGKLPTVESRFSVSQPEDTGTISGTCISGGTSVIVEARETGSRSAIYRTKAFRDRNGSFSYTFTNLPPGRYTVMAFSPSVDKEPDAWIPRNPGSLHPFTPSEPFTVCPTPVGVRARWTAEHIDLTITK